MDAAEPDSSAGLFGLATVSGVHVRVQKVEYINLDGLPEAEALKLIGIEKP